MKKSFTILMALVITFFTVPFGGITALAEEKVNNDIEDGNYELSIKLLKEGTDEKSAAADFMNDNATLTIENGKKELTFYIPNNPIMSFNKFEVEGKQPTNKEIDGLNYYTFTFDELKTTLSALVSYEVPGVIKHDDVGMDIQVIGLNELPVKEEPTEAPDERQVGNLLTENEADAVYKLEYETESTSTSAQILNPVKLLEKSDKQFIQIPINERGANFFKSLEINGEQVTWNSITEGPYIIQFELPGDIEDTLMLDMVIQAGPRVMPHNDIEIWFNTETIETIKEPEEEEPKPAPEERIVDNIITESEADTVNELEYKTESSATSAQLLNPVKLLEKNGKQYIQIPVNERGANFFRSLEINGEQVTWNSITEGPYIIQFELPGNIEDTLMLDMVIQAGPRVMPHNDIEIWFNTDKNKEPKQINLGEKISLESDMTYTVQGDVKLIVPKGLNDDVELEVISKKAKDLKNLDNLKVAGQVYDFKFSGLKGNENPFELVMTYDSEKYTADEVDIYYYDEVKSQWIAQNGTIENGEITIHPTHFSMYGVFASEQESENKDQLVPDSAHEIDFVINHETDDVLSVADGFFEDKAILLEKNGQRYIQISTTANSGQYIKSLKNKLGDKFEEMVIVEKTEDGRTIFQFKVDGELSDVILINMIINVQGVYENQPHDARLVLDQASLMEVDASQYLLVASTNSNGPDAPEGVTPVDPTPGQNPEPTPESDPTLEKPDFGNGDDSSNNEDNENAVTPSGNNNPQTGDTTSILLYTMLLIGSLIPLAVKLRRRFV